MEVIAHSPSGSPSNDPFDFNSARICLPYLSAPSSPKRFGDYYYLSAPPTPSEESESPQDLFDDGKIESAKTPLIPKDETRGRERDHNNKSPRVARSLSPSSNRISHYIWDDQSQTNKPDSIPTSKTSRRWRLTDFLLFRSASEGRASTLRKFPAFYKKPEEPKPSNPAPKIRRKEPLSAHELHYARKKAETQDLKKRTFLPYKQGILGRLAGFGSR